MRTLAACALLLLAVPVFAAPDAAPDEIDGKSVRKLAETLPAPETPASVAVAAAAAAHDPWERATAPSRASSESVGFYSRGCLRGAADLPLSGPGYERMRPSRRRSFGHPDLVDFLKSFGRAASADPNLGTVLVGDMAYPRGGPFRKGHKSHQTGLDADMWYRLVPNGTRLSDADREQWSAPSLVDYDAEGFYTGLNAAWNSKEASLLALAASDPRVERIFVSPVVKKAMCASHGSAPWISKLRAEWGHGDHFHVRLHCVGPLCEAQSPVNGDGCGPELDAEWFSPAARAEWKKISSDNAPWQMPKLPAECASVLTEP